jgi:hypothetical protein
MPDKREARSCPPLHLHGDGDQFVDIALGETKGPAPAECRAAVEHVDSHRETAPGLWLPRDEAKVWVRGGTAAS